MELLLDHAGGGDLGHAGDTLQLVHQSLIEEGGQLHRIHPLHGHRRNRDRQQGGVDLQHIGSANHIVPLGRQCGDLLRDIDTDGVHIDRVFKLHEDHGIILTGGGGDLDNMLQRGHGLFHGFRDLGFHLLRACAGIGGHHHNIGEIHIGQQVRGHLEKCDHTQNQNCDHRDKNRQRFFDRKFRHTALLTRRKRRSYNMYKSISPIEQLINAIIVNNSIFCVRLIDRWPWI